MARVKRVPRGKDPGKYSSYQSGNSNNSVDQSQQIDQNIPLPADLCQAPNEDDAVDLTNNCSDREDGNPRQNDDCADETTGQIEKEHDENEIDFNNKCNPSFPDVTSLEITGGGNVEKVDFSINPLMLTILMVSNLVDEQDDLFIDSLACPMNARHIYRSRLSCVEEGQNLFMKLLAECPEERLNSVFDGNFMLSLTGLKFISPDKQHGCENYSPLVSTSRSNSGVNYDVGTYVAVPLTSEDLLKALAKLGFLTSTVYESLTKMNLVRAFFRAVVRHAPRNNSVETLSTFIKTFMLPYLNEGAELWGVQDLSDKLDQGDRKFLRRFIHLNFCRLYRLGLHIADGAHRLTCANNAICSFNPSKNLPNSQDLVDKYFDVMPHCSNPQTFGRLARKVNVYIPTRLNDELFSHFVNLSLVSQMAQKNGQPHNLLDFYSMVLRNVNQILPSLYIWDHPELHTALSNDIYRNPNAEPRLRELDEYLIAQLYNQVGIEEEEIDIHLTELRECKNAKGRSKDVSVAGHVVGGIIQNEYVKVICQAMTSSSIPKHLLDVAEKHGNINTAHFSDHKKIAKAIFRSKQKNTFRAWVDGIRPFPFTMNGLDDIVTSFEESDDPFSDGKKYTLFKRDLEGGLALTQDEVILFYLLFCSRLSNKCNRLLSNFFQGGLFNDVKDSPFGPQLEQRCLPTNQSIRTYLRAAFYTIRQSVVKSKNIWKKVIFAKSKFLHPIQELDEDLIFLVLLPSGVEEGIN